MARDAETVRSIARNRRARHRYLVLDEIECGIALRGTEVKSLRAGHCSIGEAYGAFRKGELWLVGATIPEYSHGNAMNHEPTRDRKLLLHGRELRKWQKESREKGITVVPLEVLFRGHLVKVVMALVRGKRLHDKRQAEKAKGAKKEMRRALGRRR